MKIGFTGSRAGMTLMQITAVAEFLRNAVVDEVHHGCCLGADSQFHDVCQGWRPVVAHPPISFAYMATCFCDERREPKEYLVRDRDIVDETDLLIGAPVSETEHHRGGTWYTIHYAMKVGKPVVVLWPNGSVERREPIKFSPASNAGREGEG